MKRLRNSSITDKGHKWINQQVRRLNNLIKPNWSQRVKANVPYVHLKICECSCEWLRQNNFTVHQKMFSNIKSDKMKINLAEAQRFRVTSQLKTQMICGLCIWILKMSFFVQAKFQMYSIVQCKFIRGSDLLTSNLRWNTIKHLISPLKGWMLYFHKCLSDKQVHLYILKSWLTEITKRKNDQNKQGWDKVSSNLGMTLNTKLLLVCVCVHHM